MATVLKPIRAVVFDVYGTLAEIRNRRAPFKRLLRYAEEQGREPQADDAALVMAQHGSLSEVAARLGVSLPEDLYQQLEADLQAELSSIRLFDDVNSTLAMLRDRRLKLALCSNLAEPYAAPILAQLGLPLDCYAWSFEVGAVKPDPRIYAYVLQRLGCAAEEVLFVGDSVEADFAGPTRIGMRARLIERGRRRALQVMMEGLNGILQ
ncbi:haloacid dehalogenase [Chitiniphilus shinanonensis]|uniref:Haloacid dehalogenase n=1 Tax=Chitiniphilus shinanonensis TaxID=553088 RepID=A0ABQ6BW33_9NEIS|nr:HAD family hydrolase [Chitiniphilus shinanonensis]GLS05390.1 haloacid dehalogenase [Chitiniphilus shinanonensis]